ncbi:hypothetical protein KCU67_g8398, partial [Aureobasidium melanogenum]
MPAQKRPLHVDADEELAEAFANDIIETRHDTDAVYLMASEVVPSDTGTARMIGTPQKILSNKYIPRLLSAIQRSHSELLKSKVVTLISKSSHTRASPVPSSKASTSPYPWPNSGTAFNQDWDVQVAGLEALGVTPKYLSKFTGGYNDSLLITLCYPVKMGIEQLDAWSMLGLQTAPTMKLLASKLGTPMEELKDTFLLDVYSEKMKVPSRHDMTQEQEPWKLLPQEQQEAHRKFFVQSYRKSTAKVAIVAGREGIDLHRESHPNAIAIRLSQSVKLFGKFEHARLERDGQSRVTRIVLLSYHPEGITRCTNANVLELLDDVWTLACAIAGRPLGDLTLFARCKTRIRPDDRPDWNLIGTTCCNILLHVIRIVSWENNNQTRVTFGELCERVQAHILKENITDRGASSISQQLLDVWRMRGIVAAGKKYRMGREEWAKQVPFEQLDRSVQELMSEADRRSWARMTGAPAPGLSKIDRKARDAELQAIDPIAYVKLVTKRVRAARNAVEGRARVKVILEDRAKQGLPDIPYSEVRKQDIEDFRTKQAIEDPKKAARNLRFRTKYNPTLKAKNDATKARLGTINAEREKSGEVKLSLRQLQQIEKQEKDEQKERELEELRLNHPKKYQEKMRNHEGYVRRRDAAKAAKIAETEKRESLETPATGV